LGDQDYLIGDFSLADIVMTPHLNALASMKWQLADNLIGYVARLVQRPSWQAVLAYAAPST
jgi:glutathione S-transferase